MYRYHFASGKVEPLKHVPEDFEPTSRVLSIHFIQIEWLLASSDWPV